VATPGHFLESVIGVIPAARTVGSPRNLALSAALVVAIPLLMAAMAPREKLRGAPAELLEERSADRNPGRGRSRLDASTLLGLTIALAALALVVRSFRHKGFGALDFDLLNFAFLFLGLLVWRSPDAYARAISSGMSEASGIVLQFPFYAGILGMMKSTGMVDRLAQAGAAVGHGVFLVSTFVAATVVNMFVPSGGAQWASRGRRSCRPRISWAFPRSAWCSPSPGATSGRTCCNRSGPWPSSARRAWRLATSSATRP
jgi:short-chain fatty acids transporter